MNKVKILPFLLFAALLLAAFFIAAANTGVAKAQVDPAYKFSLASYKVTYDISDNCSIAVTEDITVSYEGYASTGFIRDIPVNAGAQVRNVDVKKLNDGKLSAVNYSVDIEYRDFISVDIGDYTNKKGVTESYRLTYTYNITNKSVNGGVLPLNPIGTGWECTISGAEVTLILPDGYQSAKCYYGAVGSTAELEFSDSQTNDSGRTVITASCSYLAAYNGITFYLTFADGAIKSYTDFTPYIFIIIGLVILVLLIVLKLLVFNKSVLTPVVNYEASHKMDPLIMGKLIDNKVNSEDITSLIYYWADKGYLKINLDDKDNPVLIKIVKALPETSPNYEQIIFNNMFARGDAVQTGSLSGTFYGTVQQATAQVNAQTKGLYDSKTIGISVIFAIIGGLLMGVAPLAISIFFISSTMMYLTAFIALIPALLIYAGAETVMYYRLKLSRGKLIGLSVAMVALCAVFTTLYTLLLPSSLIGTLPKILLGIISCAIIGCSVSLISRTKAYTEKLNDIVGFRNFIILAEKDQLEMLLEDDPQFYYHILPYAQVLGVTDKWEEKFKDITVTPPRWLTGNTVNTVLEFYMINTLIRGSMAKMSAGMISRPSSSSSNGGGGRFGGFGGGGFSGGGFGGGGGRGR